MRKVSKADLQNAARVLGKAGGIRAWIIASENGKPSAKWREQSRKGGRATAAHWNARAIRRAYKRAVKPSPELVAAVTEQILALWGTMQADDIAEKLGIHSDTVRKRVRIARRNGDERAFAKKPGKPRKQ